ncbi:MAG: hypothetical protein HQK61_08605, partial [Desulfamplus sp.]|nr:hypothetical protein [Desulfamplus sp.]
MTELIDVAKKFSGSDVNETVRELLNRYQQASQEVFRKILSDKEAKHDQIIDVLNSRLLFVQAEREEFADKIKSLDEVLKVRDKEIETLRNEVKEKDTQISGKTKELESKAKEIEVKGKEIETLRNEVKEKDTQISGKTKEPEDKPRQPENTS